MVQLACKMKQLKINSGPLSVRQNAILTAIHSLQKANNQQILDYIKTQSGEISRMTLIRDVNFLLQEKLLKKNGKGRGVWYEASFNPLLQNVDSDGYFKVEPDKRVLKKEKIEFLAKNSDWEGVFSNEEMGKLEKLTLEYRKKLSKLAKQQLAKELERITIEFSWKSSLIEGNTYSLLDTERLLKAKEEAPGHKHDEATMIINHKAALEFAWEKPAYFKTISSRKIQEMHDLIVKNLNIQKGLRKRPVGIIGTSYKPHDNQYQIREAIEDLCVLVNKLKSPFLKALVAICGLSYIQPFEDGNKRTSRLIGNSILLANKCCPLSYRSIDEIEYKKAVILFYEQNSLFLFKKLFIEQYEFAVKNYF